MHFLLKKPPSRRFTISLEERSLKSRPLGDDILSHIAGWKFELSDRHAQIRIILCPFGCRELLTFPVLRLRRVLAWDHRIHPEIELVFVDRETRQPVLFQKGLDSEPRSPH